MRNIRNILSVVCGYAAAVIGAGFASGQEIISFFVKYGKYSIIGVLLSCIIFSVFAYAVLSVCVEKNIETYSDYLNNFFRYNIRKIVEIITLLFAISTVCVMTACAGEMLFILFGIKKIFGAIIFNAVCGMIFFMNNKKIMGINSILGAIIIFGIIFCCFYILRFREHQVFSNEVKMTVSSISYAGYNLITTGAILAGMSRFLQDRKEAAVASVMSGVVLFVMMLLIWTVLEIYYGKINLGEIPMLTMALRQNKVFGAIYGIMLFFAVITTDVSNGFNVLDIASRKIGKNVVVFFMTVIAVAMSGAGFSKIINTAYRLCGYGGLVLVFYVIYNFIKNMNKVENECKNENTKVKLAKNKHNRL